MSLKTREILAKDPTNSKFKLNYLQSLWRRFLDVEILFILYSSPTYLYEFALNNFPLEQTCRTNLGYNAATCLAKGIDCEPMELALKNATKHGPTTEELTVDVFSNSFNFTACKAAAQTQTIVSKVYEKCDAMVFMFPLIILLFAGGWVDRYNKCKAVMILPLVGECLYFVTLLIAAIWFDSLPFEFGGYLETIVPAMFGGQACLLMSVFTYMSISTPEKHRVLRFGIFAVVSQLHEFVFIVFRSSSNFLGYTISFATGALFQVAAIIYVVMFIKEPKPHEKASELPDQDDLKASEMESPKIEIRRNVLREFFDPSLVVELVKLPFKRRANNERLILLLLMLCYILTSGPEAGEAEYINMYSDKKPVWNKNFDYRAYIVVKRSSAIFGTFFGTVFLSKMLKFSDSMLGIWSAIFTVVSRLLYAFVADTPTYYAAGVLDLFSLFRYIPIKTIASTVIEGEAKFFSLLGILEPIEAQVFSAIYKKVYALTSKSFPGAVFLLSELLYLPNVLIFIACYFLLRRHNTKMLQTSEQNEQQS